MSTGLAATMVKRNDESAKIDAAVLRDARLVAGYRGITIAEYLSEVLAPIVEKDLIKEQEKDMERRRAKGAGGKPPKN